LIDYDVPKAELADALLLKERVCGLERSFWRDYWMCPGGNMLAEKGELAL
jgi:hypothetical protein